MRIDPSIFDTIRATIPPIHRAGWPFITAFAVVSLLLGMIWHPFAWVGLLATLWCVYFFRDPFRVTPIREGLVISPADGLVQKIATVAPPVELGIGTQERIRISIFLNVFDVHVNRIPHEGTISRLHYVPGTFVNAALDKASEDNERQLVRISLADGRDIGVVQIAGWVARRILCDLKEGQGVKTGERFGIIRFGSRVDVYLPPDVTPLVIEGQYMIGGETILADLSSAEVLRVGVRH